MAAKAGGKKGKKKGTTMALTDFLSDESGNPQGPGSSYVLSNKPVDSWAAEMEDLDISSDPTYGTQAVDRTRLPTAPKASRGVEDLERVPTDPPFTAFIGNLPYEVSEEKIADFFRQQKVVNVRLPEDNGRFRGFGYVQFETRQDLIDAMGMTDEILGGRKVRVDLAGQDRDKDGNQRGGGGGRDDGQPDRTEGNWRSAEPRQESGGGYDDRGSRGGYEDRGSRGGFEDRGSRGGFEDRGSRGGFEDRGSRGGGYEEPRGGSRGGYEDRASEGSWTANRGKGGSSYEEPRGSQGGYGDRGSRGGYEEPWGSRGSDRDGGGSRGFGGDRGGRDYGGDRGGGSSYGGDRGGGYGRDRNDDREGGGRSGGGYRSDDRGGGFGGRDGGERNGYREARRDEGYGPRSDRQDSREEPKERPRLNLQPRTTPVENKPAPKAPTAAPTPKKSSASIFGGAKPVDTAQREKEIEEKLRNQKSVDPRPKHSSLESRGYGDSGGYQDPRDHPREIREKRYEESKPAPWAPPSAAARKRSDSDKSQEGDAVRRERHSSSGSNKSGKSKKGSRRDSDQSAEVFSGGEDHREDKTHTAVSPAQREEAAKLVPAPPPKENIWEKRKTTQPSPQKPEESRSPPAAQSKPPQAEPSARSPPAPKTQQSQPSKQHNPPAQSRSPQSSSEIAPKAPASDGKPKAFVPAAPPTDNPWTRRKQEQDHKGPAGPAGPGMPGSGAARGGGDRGRGRGGRGGFGRGRGEPHPPRKERPVPQSIDEMPKYEETSSKDFSDNNKFAGLLDDDDDEDES